VGEQVIDGSSLLITFLKIALWSILVLAVAYLIEIWRDRKWR
jgi:hypothetical protein